MHIYGIKNCDTVKKSLKWLAAQELDFVFHDFKKEALTAEKISEWMDKVPLELLINKRGTSWRQLPESQKNFDDKEQLIKLVIEKPTLLKRPLVEYGENCSVGFNADQWQQQFSS